MLEEFQVSSQGRPKFPNASQTFWSSRNSFKRPLIHSPDTPIIGKLFPSKTGLSFWGVELLSYPTPLLLACLSFSFPRASNLAVEDRPIYPPSQAASKVPEMLSFQNLHARREYGGVHEQTHLAWPKHVELSPLRQQRGKEEGTDASEDDVQKFPCPWTVAPGFSGPSGWLVTYSPSSRLFS